MDSNLVKLTRELGKAIQATETFKKVLSAVQTNEADSELTALVNRVQELQAMYRAGEESGKKPEELAAYENEFNEVYAKIQQNDNMKHYQEAQKELDEMMNYLVHILALCAGGADPDTCKPKKE